MRSKGTEPSKALSFHPYLIKNHMLNLGCSLAGQDTSQCAGGLSLGIAENMVDEGWQKIVVTREYFTKLGGVSILSNFSSVALTIWVY